MKGDPNNCNGDPVCISKATIATIPPVAIAAQGQITVSRSWIFDGIQNIYAIIDPLNTINGKNSLFNSKSP